MANFIRLPKSKTTINLEAIAYVREDCPGDGDVLIVFLAADPTPDTYVNGGPLTYALTGSDAETFLGAFMRQVAVW